MGPHAIPNAAPAATRRAPRRGGHRVAPAPRLLGGCPEAWGGAALGGHYSPSPSSPPTNSAFSSAALTGGTLLRRFPGGGWSSRRRRKGAARARRAGSVTSWEAAGRREPGAAAGTGAGAGSRGGKPLPSTAGPREVRGALTKTLKGDRCCWMPWKGVPAPCGEFLVFYGVTY